MSCCPTVVGRPVLGPPRCPRAGGPEDPRHGPELVLHLDVDAAALRETLRHPLRDLRGGGDRVPREEATACGERALRGRDGPLHEVLPRDHVPSHRFTSSMKMLNSGQMTSQWRQAVHSSSLPGTTPGIRYPFRLKRGAPRG